LTQHLGVKDAPPASSRFLGPTRNIQLEDRAIPTSVCVCTSINSWKLYFMYLLLNFYTWNGAVGLPQQYLSVTCEKSRLGIIMHFYVYL